MDCASKNYLIISNNGITQNLLFSEGLHITLILVVSNLPRNDHLIDYNAINNY